MNRVIKTYNRLDQNFIFDTTIYERSWDQIMKVSFVSISLISYDLCLLLHFVNRYLCFLFRSRSYPVPHRGERVKKKRCTAEIRIKITPTEYFFPFCFYLSSSISSYAYIPWLYGEVNSVKDLKMAAIGRNM